MAALIFTSITSVVPRDTGDCLVETPSGFYVVPATGLVSKALTDGRFTEVPVAIATSDNSGTMFPKIVGIATTDGQHRAGRIEYETT
ncbi:hypothetical protein [Gordonia sihwensis]|uniref:hypothetical protein n=1 Tax=Gordonia sihwensis TaxID=173559 RepID=UPI003D984C2D